MQLLIDRHVERTNRNLLITHLGLLAILAAGAALSAGYLGNYFGGPFSSTLDEIARAPGGMPQRSFVRVEGELLGTGYEHVTRTVDKHTRREKSRRVDATYLAIQEGNRTLIIKAPVGTQGPGIAGWLDRPGSVERQIVNELRQKDADLAASVLPVILDATASRTPGTVGLIAAGVALLVALAGLRTWSSRRTRPASHPIWKRLAKLGETRSLAAQIDMEARGTDVARFKGGATLTRSWLLRETLYRLDLVPIDRLAWIHKKVTAHKQAFITVGRTFEGIVCDRDGGRLVFRAREPEIDRLLGEILGRAPWVLAGWSAELEKAWASRRQEMLSAVDARREQQRRAAGGEG